MLSRMPRLAPVTSAVLPVRSKRSFWLMAVPSAVSDELRVPDAFQVRESVEMMEAYAAGLVQKPRHGAVHHREIEFERAPAGKIGQRLADGGDGSSRPENGDGAGRFGGFGQPAERTGGARAKCGPRLGVLAVVSAVHPAFHCRGKDRL